MKELGLMNRAELDMVSIGLSYNTHVEIYLWLNAVDGIPQYLCIL